MDKNEVNITFEILLEEIELVINNLNEFFQVVGCCAGKTLLSGVDTNWFRKV